SGAGGRTPVPALDRPAAASVSGGIACALAAWLLFAGMDAGSKLLAERYSIIQILWVRFVSLVVIAAWLARQWGGSDALRTRHFWLQSLRSMLLVVEIGLFILTITVLPLANAHAILAATPLIVTALSVPLLGEHVGIRRWSAIAVAFAGVLIILRPGLGVVHPIALLALLCSLMFALYQILTRIVSRTDPPLTTLFYTALVGVGGLTLIVPFHWTTPDVAGWALFGLVAALGASGHYLLIKALQLAPASVLQPFSYTILVWATLVGFLVFGNLPDRLTVVGALVIASSGVYGLRPRAPPPGRPGLSGLSQRLPRSVSG
ncbi:MAG: DMT family transporter, partial [Geminicoccaceae bacterium]